ncbi:ZIP zinc transporter-domain-containing protein [Sporodiniella umbellata]|nr:ZIP zinc transporter-domain-containing protein [Sporodiniella umbellata]
MSDYWVSQQKHWCKYCKKFVANNKPSISLHESGQAHKDKVEGFLRNVYKKGKEDKEKEEEVRREIQRIEQVARSSSSKKDGIALVSGGSRPTHTSSTASRPSRTGGVTGSYGYGADYYVPSIHELRNPPPEPVLEQGREEWAVKKDIAQVGHWEMVAQPEPPVTNKVHKKDQQIGTTHDQAPEFQDDDEDGEDLQGFKIKEKEYPADTLAQHEDCVLFKKRKVALNDWLGVLISSIACVVGAAIVFIDKLFHKPLLDNRSFMASSMALASGVLLFSSLAILFPQAQKRLTNDAILYTCFFAGAIFTLCITKLIHFLMPDAIHACGDAEEACGDHHPTTERQKLNKNRSDIEYGSIPNNEAHIRLPHEENETRESSSEHSFTPHHHHHLLESHHHHSHHESAQQAAPASSHYLNIGIQTAIAICIHKFPEGLIMLVSSKASTSLGLNVCMAMSVHNLTEGFMIALPLYYATRSRMKAFIAAALLGGLSQPVGALLGYMLIKNISKSKEDLMFGLVFGCVSGMMTLITVQSMFPQAIRADVHQHYGLAFFFLGVFLVGISSVLGSL